ncbi:hypothetical protein D9V37_06555 [Nocardioides mangrovicus]|uniref:Uncharacterized protein n=1 Tax=Nocardioides mangrovicus TaxID=2478913 RepID=A0A3L8P2L3_9ACTN|nr:hypothetical protein [Nocardioides mangrovicus]RLV49580.1 hypothetical protein D9V37_06555 [Nocardioides mangrovicus]
MTGGPEHDEEQRATRDWGPHEPFGTEDAARIGLDRNTLEGAQLAFFSHLDPRKPSHKLVAWVALLLLVGWPLLVTVMHLLGH